jgi:hypothetical protein
MNARAVIRNRWAPVGLVGHAIFLINALARLISNITIDDSPTAEAAAALDKGADPIALVRAGAVVLLIVLAGARCRMPRTTAPGGRLTIAADLPIS